MKFEIKNGVYSGLHWLYIAVVTFLTSLSAFENFDIIDN